MGTRLEKNTRWALGCVSILFIVLGVLDWSATPWSATLNPLFAALSVSGAAYLGVIIAEFLGRSAEERANKVVGTELVSRIAQANAEVINKGVPGRFHGDTKQFGDAIFFYFVSGDAKTPRYWQVVRVEIKLMVASDTWVGSATPLDSEDRPVEYRFEVIRMNDMLVVGSTQKGVDRYTERTAVFIFDGASPQRTCFGILSHHDWVGNPRLDPAIYKAVPIKLEGGIQLDQTQRIDDAEKVRTLDEFFLKNINTLGTFDRLFKKAKFMDELGTVPARQQDPV